MENIIRHQWISEAAYYNAEARRFAPGRELDDWLAAENEYVKMEIGLYLSIAEEDGGMTTQGLQQLANSVGVENPKTINQKIELIHAIQDATQDQPCFRSVSRMDCLGEDCQWRVECKKQVAVWRR